MSSCLYCEQTVGRVLDLGPQPVSNRFLRPEEDPEKQYRHPLILGRCEGCSLLQLIDPMPAREVVPRFDWIQYNEPEGHLDTVCRPHRRRHRSQCGRRVGRIDIQRRKHAPAPPGTRIQEHAGASTLRRPGDFRSARGARIDSGAAHARGGARVREAKRKVRSSRRAASSRNTRMTLAAISMRSANLSRPADTSSLKFPTSASVSRTAITAFCGKNTSSTFSLTR